MPRASHKVLLAGGTRKTGSPVASVITAPFPRTAQTPVLSLHSSRMPLRAAMLAAGLTFLSRRAR